MHDIEWDLVKTNYPRLYIVSQFYHDLFAF